MEQCQSASHHLARSQAWTPLLRQGFLAEGLQRTSAGLGSVIIDSQPLTVALLASLLFGERLSAVGYGGLVAGVAGLCLLEVPPAALQALVTDGPAGALDRAQLRVPPRACQTRCQLTTLGKR